MEQTNILVRNLRIAYPLWFITGIYSFYYVPLQYLNLNDPETTAAEIQANELLFRMGVLGELVVQFFFLYVGWLLYRLFKTENASVSLLMLMLVLAAVPMAMLNQVNDLTALKVIEQPELLMDSLITKAYGLRITKIFWGLWLFPLAYLVMKSPLFPRFLGFLLIAGGSGYTLEFVGKMLAEESELFYQVCSILTLGEPLWMLWVVVMGARDHAEDKVVEQENNT